MVALYHQGYDVVSAQRVEREGEGLFKRGTAALFYGLMRKAVDPRLPPQVGDFRLFSHAAVVALCGFREQHRFLRGLVAWLGLKEAILPFRRRPRVAGITKYPTWKMIRFAWTAISSFSALPLRLSLGFGLFLTAVGIVYAFYAVYETLALQATVRGWSSLVSLLVVFSGAILTAIGLVGEYVARIYDEAKGRPLYVLANSVNLATSSASPARTVVLPVCEIGGDTPRRDPGHSISRAHLTFSKGGAGVQFDAAGKKGRGAPSDPALGPTRDPESSSSL
jgi:dolichol-phosphate mannosyltransferase